ncbi:hypothetical protein RI129_004146 [Pyrocoelia pectoralis]|uniref:Peptidase S1 domain-containing protein n=1 Tax=Pyrocoelia pectoralis TaxID=417401 RepID=A0AAN7ZKA7_9COLE
MHTFGEEFVQAICYDKKTGIFTTILLLIILGLLGFSIYLVAKPIECVENKPQPITTYRGGSRFNKESNCKETSILKSPFLVALIDRDINWHVCSGIIVADSWIITTAHCLSYCQDEKCANYAIRIGSSYSNRGGTIHNITSIIIHPLYKNHNLDNDIALIKMDSSASNRRIKIASPSIEDKGGLLGWSQHSKTSVNNENVLKKMYFTIKPSAVCNHKLKGDYVKIEITDRTICAITAEGCPTDSGGPLISNNKLVGMVVFTKICYSCYYQITIGINVYAYIDFIQQFITDYKLLDKRTLNYSNITIR